MSKAEKFIEEHTSNRINAIQCYDGDCNPQVIYKPWITPVQAKKAVEIAREEMIEKVCNFITEKLFFKDNMLYTNIKSKIVEDIKHAMKDE